MDETTEKYIALMKSSLQQIIDNAQLALRQDEQARIEVLSEITAYTRLILAAVAIYETDRTRRN